MTDESTSNFDANRRRLLKAIGAGAFVTSLAGCNQQSSGSGTSKPAPSATAGSTPTATAAPTATSQPTTAQQQTTQQTTTATLDGPTAGLSPCVASLAGKPSDACQSPQEISGSISKDTTLGKDCKQYKVTGTLTVENGANLTVEPGTRLEFGQNVGLSVQDASSLTATGTCGEPIVFTGEQQTRGYWKGIQFIGANQTQSKLEYVVVEYGGGDKYTWAPAKGNLVVLSGSSSSRVSVSNSTFRESGAYGVTFGDGVTVSGFSKNVVTKNDTAAGYVDAKTAHLLSADSTFKGNDHDYVAVRGSKLGTDYEETWDAIDVPYRVDSGTNVSINGHLTIAPGATIRFGQNAGMQVYGDGPGVLTAVGMTQSEEVKPITFTGDQKTRGYWKGLLFQNTDQVPSRLQHCVVEYGGGDKYTWAEAAANVAIIDGSRVNVSNSTIRESDSFGLLLSDDVIVNDCTSNTITRNDVAGRAFASTAHYLSDTSTFKGNDHDYVHVRGNDFNKDLEETWDAIDVPYRIQSSTGVDVNGHLTVAPGATIEFDQNASLQVLGDGPGRFTAVGVHSDTEKVEPITFTGVQKTRGYWRGILFQGTDRTENQLRQCVVEYGGGDKFTWSPEKGNVNVIDGSRIRIDDSTIRESDAYGFVVDGDSKTNVDSFTKNTVTRNRDGAGWMRASKTHFLSDTSTFQGNDTDAVFVRGEDVPASVDGTWDGIDAAYRVTNGSVVTVNGHITIDPGATIEFEQNAGMLAYSDGPGAITAVGTSDAPITFTGDQKTPGYWRGLGFEGTSRVENKLVHCVVEYGGGDNYTWSPAKGNVMVFSGSRLTLQNSTVRNGAAYGVVVESDSTLSSSGNTVQGNAIGSVVTK